MTISIVEKGDEIMKLMANETVKKITMQNIKHRYQVEQGV